MRSRLSLILCVLSLSAALAGCGGSSGGAPTPPPTSNNPPPPPPPPPPPVIGAEGGTVTEASGASVTFPAGAVTTDTTFRIAMDSTGAPPLPASLNAAGSIYVITPHGGNFSKPVEVSIPAPNVTLLDNQEFKLAKAEPNGEWEILHDSALVEGRLTAAVESFSFFSSVIITYALPIAQAPPFDYAVTLSCGEQDCSRLVGPAEVSFTLVGNGGQLPADCADGHVGYTEHANVSTSSVEIPRSFFSVNKVIQPGPFVRYHFIPHLRCPGSTAIGGSRWQRYVDWMFVLSYPNLAVERMPTQLDVVEGLQANLDALLSGGALQGNNVNGTLTLTPTPTDRAVIDWQRSDDGGTSWRNVARSFQNEANPQPFGTGMRWRPWSVRHGFIATATDQGALIRVHACYAPPAPTAPPPCVTSPATRINVLQQSALPAIVEQPRAVLIRVGETANLTVAASGLPAPTLQWQTRPANSIDAWSDVTTGAGATTGNYTTAPLTLTDNGVQYRVVATNALGSAESTAATVSVSDLDVAPTITTQPASLGVTAGSDAVFAVAARGTEALSYQWRFNGAAIAGANGAVLRLSAVSNADAGSYSVTVSNDAGEADSNAAILTVTAGAPPAVAPTIVTQPAAVTVNVGATATFAIGVDGSGPFTFQWRRNGVNIPGATAAVLTLNAVVVDAAANYSVLVGNSANPSGVVSDEAALTVTSGGGAEAPTIVTQPATIVVAPGGSGVLAVAATGSGPLFYQWLANGVPLSGETEAVLVLPAVSEADVGDYAVEVSNALGTVVSNSASVMLLGAPVIFTSPAHVSVFENSISTFRVDAGGAGLHYQWLRNGSPIASSDANAYTTPMLTLADSGAVYSVIVFNSAGLVVSAPAVLTVRTPNPPTVLQQPADATVTAGQFANLCAAFGGAPPFNVQLTRWTGSQWTPITNSLFVDNAEHCMITPVLQLADNGAQFRFLASNEGGLFEATTRTVTVTVSPPPLAATTIVSVSSSGVTANNRSAEPSLSADGRIVAFTTDGTNLAPGFTNPPAFGRHAYVRNLATGVTMAINQTPAGGQSIYGVSGLKLAAGGRHAVFTSLAGDLVADDTNGSQDVFVRDLQTGVTQRVSLRADGSQVTDAGNGVGDMQIDISTDGRWVSFVSNQDLISNGPPGAYALYLRNVQTSSLRRVASSATYSIAYSALSSDGEHMAYAFGVPAPLPTVVYHHDVAANTSWELFSLDASSGADYLGQGMSISGDGRYIAFAIRSDPLLGSTTPQVVVLDRLNPATLTIASTGSAGSGVGVGDAASSFPKLSNDGRYVLFATWASNLTSGVANANRQALVLRDLQAQTTTVASRRPDGVAVWIAQGVYNSHALSGDGSLLALTAYESDMTGGMAEHQLYIAPRP